MIRVSCTCESVRQGHGVAVTIPGRAIFVINYHKYPPQENLVDERCRQHVAGNGTSNERLHHRGGSGLYQQA